VTQPWPACTAWVVAWLVPVPPEVPELRDLARHRENLDRLRFWPKSQVHVVFGEEGIAVRVTNLF
jgi:hypothetical protein